MVFPSSGTGAWEAALVNTLDPGDRVLMAETGHFATLWRHPGPSPGARPRSSSPVTGATGWTPRRLERHLAEDEGHEIRAVLVVHNETCTGVDQPGSPRSAGPSTAPAIRRC